MVGKVLISRLIPKNDLKNQKLINECNICYRINSVIYPQVKSVPKIIESEINSAISNFWNLHHLLIPIQFYQMSSIFAITHNIMNHVSKILFASEYLYCVNWKII